MQAAVALSGQPTRTPLVPSRLDELLALDAPSLASLYQSARVPSLASVAGPLRGRMLAWPKVGGRAGRALRAWASSSRFPWRGKSFASQTSEGRSHARAERETERSADDERRRDEKGEGINRVVLDRFRLFRFETAIGPSRAGDFDALQLDYDLPENPWFIRRIKDEMRELGPGLWLGQAYWHTARADHLVLYFGLTAP